MSLSFQPQACVTVMDPVADIDSERFYTVLKGGARKSIVPFKAQNSGNSSFVFQITPPSPSTIIDRRFRIQAKLRVKITKATGGSEIAVRAGFDSVRAMVMASITESLDIRLNNGATSIQMADLIHPLSRVSLDRNTRNFVNNGSPNKLDISQSYSELQKTNSNPLAAYGDNTYENARGAFRYTVVAPAPTTDLAVIDVEIDEPLYISPFVFGADDKPGLVGLNSLQITMNLTNNWDRVWSAVTKDKATTFDVTFPDTPSIFCTFISPKELQVIPPMLTYSYNEITRYTQSQELVAHGARKTMISNNIQLKVIPHKMLIFVRKPVSQMKYDDTDSYFGIEKVRINFDNRNSILGTASSFDLYQISRKNGLQLTWNDWRGSVQNVLGESTSTVGGVLCLEFGTDIELGDTLAPGVLGTFQFSAEVDVRNTHPTKDITPELVIVCINDGTLTIDTISGQVSTQIGVLTQQDVVNAPLSNAKYNEVKQIVGGNFMSTFNNILHKYARPAASAIHMASDLAKKVGLGLEGHGLSGGGLSGGKLYSRSQLKKRLSE